MAVTLSAHDEGALRALCADWAAYLESASPEEAAAAGRLSMRAFSGERLRLAALGETPGALAEALRRAATEATPGGVRAAILHVVPSEVVDLLAEPGRRRIAATRAAEGARAAEACMRAEIESLLRSLFPDAVASEEALRSGETVLLVGSERVAARPQAVDADRAASLPVLLELWRAGLASNAASLGPGPLARPARLPGYRFARRSHWHTHLPAPGSAAALAADAEQSELLRLDEPALLPEVLERIRQEVAEILAVAPEEIDTRANLYDVGFDSVMALELRNALVQKHSVEVGLAPLMEAQCLEDVARAILPALARLRDDRPAAAAPATEIVL